MLDTADRKRDKTMKKINRKRICSIILCAAMIILSGLNVVSAQSKWSPADDGCGGIRWIGNPNGAFSLEIKEQTLAQPPSKIIINSARSGGVRIRGWERNEIWVRACVQSAGRDENEARARTAAVRITTENNQISAVSDLVFGEANSFGASFDIRVPVNTDLKIATQNGGINLFNVRGDIEFDIKNGGATLNRIAGDVRGQTGNGSLTLNLSGERWEGGGINIGTTNGNILINFPENYSARLETGNRSRRFRTNFLIEKHASGGDRLDINLGAGGAIIKATTTNGQISIERRANLKQRD
ncbi:MAG: hypothetical protein H7Z37_13570 [Pyrinomonadaceae bacterium]|nr:hypothetical protein [Pyrinomonadaceae bacterium]